MKHSVYCVVVFDVLAVLANTYHLHRFRIHTV